MAIRIALSKNMYDNKSVAKKMRKIWDVFCREMAMVCLPLPIIFLPETVDCEIDFSVRDKEGPNTLVIPPMTATEIVRGFHKDVLRTDLKMKILGIVFSELSKRICQMEYLAKNIDPTKFEQIRERALEVIFSGADAEVALMAEDEGPPLKLLSLPESTKILFLFMYSRYKKTLESQSFFEQLIQKGWRFC